MKCLAIVLALAAITVSGAQAKNHHRVVITKTVPVFGPVIIRLPNGQPVGSWECYTAEAQGRFMSCDL
jgi:hypothetical protein